MTIIIIIITHNNNPIKIKINLVKNNLIQVEEQTSSSIIEMYSDYKTSKILSCFLIIIKNTKIRLCMKRLKSIRYSMIIQSLILMNFIGGMYCYRSSKGGNTLE